jgi:nucleoid-associated protein YgaU
MIRKSEIRSILEEITMNRGMLLAAGLIVVFFAGCKKPDQTAPTATHKDEAFTPTYNSLDSMDAQPKTDTYQQAQPAAGDPYAADNQTLQPAGGRKHVVQKGDTLYSLARKYYNNQSRWRDIRDANKKVIADPNKLKVGTELVIP